MVHAAIQRMRDKPFRFQIVGRAVDSGERHAAEPDRRNAQVAAAEFAANIAWNLLHVASPKLRRRPQIWGFLTKSNRHVALHTTTRDDRAMSYRIKAASAAQDVADARKLIRAYTDALGIDLTFQDLEGGSPTCREYAPPGGALLIGRDDAGAAIGCVGCERSATACAKMKRLYVTPAARKTPWPRPFGIGHRKGARTWLSRDAARYDLRHGGGHRRLSCARFSPHPALLRHARSPTRSS